MATAAPDLPKHNRFTEDEESKTTKLFLFYQKSLATWPVPHEELMVENHYGDTVVIASELKQGAVGGGLSSAPTCALVLIHAAGANTTMWLGQTILDLEY